MSSSRLLATLALFGGLIHGAGAHAADVNAADASALEAQLRGWMASLVSPALDVGPRPVQVTAAGDHFDITVPAPQALTANGLIAPNQAITLKAKKLDGDRFALDDLALPSPVTLNLPKDMTTESLSAVQNFEFSATKQEFHGVLDPSFATSSSFDSIVTGLRIASANSTSLTARTSNHSIWQPTGDGKINVTTEGTAEKSATSFPGKPGEAANYTIEKSRTSSNIKSVSPASLAALSRGLAALLPTLAATKDSLNPEQRTQARTVIFALRDMFAGLEASQTLESIAFTADGHTGTIARAGFGAKMGVEDGKLQLTSTFSVEGLDSPEVPKGIYRDYLPRKITVKPRVSGVPSEDLIKLMLRAVDSDSKDMAELQEAAIALLGAGPLEIAIDELAIDLGRASLTSTGSLDIAGLTDITGEAEITVKGLDALIKTANTTPDLKPIAPVLIFLKGIGKQDGADTVWNITYQDNAVMVNDTDLSAMIPGVGGKK